MLQKYYLFYGNVHEQAGGIYDLRGNFDSIVEAIEYADTQEFEWGHIADSHFNIVKTWADHLVNEKSILTDEDNGHARETIMEWSDGPKQEYFTVIYGNRHEVDIRLAALKAEPEE